MKEILFPFVTFIGYIGIGYIVTIFVMIFDSPTLQPEESIFVVILWPIALFILLLTFLIIDMHEKCSKIAKKARKYLNIKK